MNHFDAVMAITFSDGGKYEDIFKVNDILFKCKCLLLIGLHTAEPADSVCGP